jgi:hypothetical protein
MAEQAFVSSLRQANEQESRSYSSTHVNNATPDPKDVCAIFRWTLPEEHHGTATF